MRCVRGGRLVVEGVGARLLPGCQGERANVHMSHVAERAAYAEVEMESKDARFADSAMTEDIVMEGDYKEEL